MINVDTYRALEDAECLNVIAVTYNGELVGFCTVMVVPSLHSDGNYIGTAESLFLAKEHRVGRLPVRLIRKAQEVARDKGADVFYVSAPVGGPLERLLPSLNYTPANTLFLAP